MEAVTITTHLIKRNIPIANSGYRLPVYLSILIALLGSVLFGSPAHADNVACVANGNGIDTCEIGFPDVIHPSVTYSGVQLAVGDTITSLTATGCVQTGGHGQTWKRYLDPEGDNSDHLYHGLIQLPGASAATRMKDLPLPQTVRIAGPLVLGYEDDNYGDNGYYLHDLGSPTQCDDTTLPNVGRATVQFTIKRAAVPHAPAGTAYGLCSISVTGVASCHIDRPNVTASTESYHAIHFRAGDQVVVQARGCVQTGGAGSTWKEYVNPSGDNSDHLYHGLISIPGATASLVRINSIIGQTLTAGIDGDLELGYEDDTYNDNGYYSHDNGTGNQCLNIGPASLDITITPAG